MESEFIYGCPKCKSIDCFAADEDAVETSEKVPNPGCGKCIHMREFEKLFGGAPVSVCVVDGKRTRYSNIDGTVEDYSAYPKCRDLNLEGGCDRFRLRVGLLSSILAFIRKGKWPNGRKN